MNHNIPLLFNQLLITIYLSISEKAFANANRIIGVV